MIIWEKPHLRVERLICFLKTESSYERSPTASKKRSDYVLCVTSFKHFFGAEKGDKGEFAEFFSGVAFARLCDD
jgi:hypothetical protein